MLVEGGAGWVGASGVVVCKLSSRIIVRPVASKLLPAGRSTAVTPPSIAS
jgi:hypothetical protein